MFATVTHICVSVLSVLTTNNIVVRCIQTCILLIYGAEGRRPPLSVWSVLKLLDSLDQATTWKLWHDLRSIKILKYTYLFQSFQIPQSSRRWGSHRLPLSGCWRRRLFHNLTYALTHAFHYYETGSNSVETQTRFVASTVVANILLEIHAWCLGADRLRSEGTGRYAFSRFMFVLNNHVARGGEPIASLVNSFGFPPIVITEFHHHGPIPYCCWLIFNSPNIIIQLVQCLL